MRKRSIGLLAVLLVLGFTLVGCPTDGGGDDDGITKIGTAEQFNAIRNRLDGHYVLEADIDLTSYENFIPIGAFVPLFEAPEDEETPKLELAFTGIFDGNGHKISNVTISAMQEGVGLFGCVAGDNGVVKNLVVENVTVDGFNLVAGVIGYQASTNAVENITLQGTNSITCTTKMAGGIVGAGNSDIIDCSAIADITLTGDGSQAQFVGILAGGIAYGSIIDCIVTGGSITAVAGSHSIGGLAACASLAAEVENCTVSNVTITVGADCFMVGGLLGYTGTYSPDTPTSINNCAVTNVTINTPSSSERIGGIVGSGFYASMYAAMESMPEFGTPSTFTVANSTSSGSITGGCTDLVGKIAGYIYDNSTVADTCTSTMTGATYDVGGDKDSAELSTLK
jgi:hypothetical protein